MSIMDSRIGQLGNGKFYAFANGYDAPEVCGTLEQVEVALGLRKIANRAKYRTYDVTITPTVNTSAGLWTARECVLQFDGTTPAKAISKAREWAKDEIGVPCKFRAKLAE
jgi:hypothetical protein